MKIKIDDFYFTTYLLYQNFTLSDLERDLKHHNKIYFVFDDTDGKVKELYFNRMNSTLPTVTEFDFDKYLAIIEKLKKQLDFFQQNEDAFKKIRKKEDIDNV